MSARWIPILAILGVVALSAGAMAGPHHCFGGDESSSDFTTQSIAAPPAALMAVFALVPILGGLLALAAGLRGRATAPATEGEWIATDEAWTFVPRPK